MASLSPELNALPGRFRHIHLMGICGTAMASLAGILKQEGYVVTGSDQNVYPPMSRFLEDLSIPVLEGYRAENLHPAPDLVIVGNVITKLNPEAVELARLGIPYLSLPQGLQAFAMKGKKSIVICGTHGKTTTTALIAWVLESAGLDPGFMVGGIPKNFGKSFKLGNGPYFVIEGDEYDTAFFDKGPKFLHYSPWLTVLTSIEFDHADIYRDLEHVRRSFQKLIRLIPPDGLLIANHDDPVVMAEASRAGCPVVTYSLESGGDWKAGDITVREDCTVLKAGNSDSGTVRIETPLYGRHNVSNLLSTLPLASFLGIETASLLSGLATFQGVKRRQEIKGEAKGVLVLDDFAHHPTAVRETLKAVKDKYRNRRLVAAFEPRSNSSRRNVFQEQYASAFDGADLVLIPEPPMKEKIPVEQRFSSEALVKDLALRGSSAFYFPDTGLLLEDLLQRRRAGDVVLFMSNGSFDNLPERFLKRLEESSGVRVA
ncbi:MAG: UDP-N-acetylmuramate:L-alanyl-gamma-D-glutamyl-meso-diaminopimelate ligase [Desulfobacterota bacterium]|jgi:UDP-N-acetylmuramate: L-alanyl-gamma-D-glutamyl-meso-diaminopimelate ligase|nr:UDP-N-acetylmuramate:L-alanyl-gamma-D-glutamyl-meso-diaminopimelate ligase [Thermodesulfobacteriota bacterium]